MESRERTFIYRDAKGNVTARTITEVSEREQYLQGYCQQSGGLKTFRKDRVLEYFSDIVSAKSRLQHHIATNPPPKPSRPRCSVDICFTGFKSADKERLVGIASAAGFTVRSSVTNDLSFLCGGPNAGPVKVQKAREEGSIYLDESQFLLLVETGEIPDI